MASGYSRFTDEEEDYDSVNGDGPSASSPTTLPAVGYLPSGAGEMPEPLGPVQIENGAEVDLQSVNLETRDRDRTEMAVEAEETEGGGGGGGGAGLGREDGAGGADDRGAGGGGNEADTQSSRRWSCADCYRWLMSNAVLLYISQALSAWGDRMWSFAVSLYLVEIEESSLRLTAIYGLFVSASALVFGAAVGKWVDKTPRLRAVRTSLIIQNTSVLVNACLLCVVLVLKQDILPVWNGALYVVCQLVIILLGTVASLASLAEKICIQKDWVVVVAGGDKELLAGLNANMRRIDLLVNILAPIVVGAIMSASMLVGGIFIAAWNGVSLVIEYWNIHRVYTNVPRLATKEDALVTDESPQEEEEESDRYVRMREPSPADTPAGTKEGTSDEGDVEFTEIPVTLTPAPDPNPSPPASSSDQTTGCLNRLKAGLKDMFEGWKVYQSYTEVWAGLGLALLYMTVLGFDSITNGYGYSQGLPEWAIGLSQALGSITGIAGTLLFSFLRRRLGLERAGLYSISTQISFLSLCLASVWLPGSPFIADYSGDGDVAITEAHTTGAVAFTSSLQTSPSVLTTMAAPTSNSTGVQCKYTEDMQTSVLSVALFFTGIILSRIGLWSFDLCVSQLIQERVVERERGAFNGVQRAMECSFDMVHFVLVIALPCPETFGILIILSFIFVAVGFGSYSVYSYKKRGHLIHTEKLVPCMKNGRV